MGSSAAQTGPYVYRGDKSMSPEEYKKSQALAEGNDFWAAMTGWSRETDAERLKKQQDQLLQEARDRAKNEESPSNFSKVAQDARLGQMTAINRAKGYKSTILTGPMGLAGLDTAPRKTLLGA